MWDRDSLLEIIEVEDVIKLLTEELGSDYPSRDGEAYCFTTVCHGGNKKKLYYYPNSKMFHCYTGCGTMSIYDLLINAFGMSFEEAFKYLKDFKGVKNTYVKKVGIQKKNTISRDIEFLNKHLHKHNDKIIKLPSYNENVLSIFENLYPSVWEDEGINPIELARFGIKMDLNENRAIIPNRDINGDLIGIRCRNFNKYLLDRGMKYTPIRADGMKYAFPTNANLYGIYENSESIRRYKKCIIFEAEKSVWHYGSDFGCMRNIATATLGSTLSLTQRDLVLSLGVEEVVIAYDKDFLYSEIDKGNKDHIDTYNKLIKNLIKMYRMFNGYCKFSVILCDNDNTLELKDSPIDRGKDIFCNLYRDRFMINNISILEDSLIK